MLDIVQSVCLSVNFQLFCERGKIKSKIIHCTVQGGCTVLLLCIEDYNSSFAHCYFFFCHNFCRSLFLFIANVFAPNVPPFDYFKRLNNETTILSYLNISDG